MKQIRAFTLNPETGEVEEAGKLLEKKIEAPPIEDTLAAAEQAIQQAVKTQQKRKHICRVCYKEGCNHFEREYVDTKEEVDMRIDPETGQWMEDKDAD